MMACTIVLTASAQLCTAMHRQQQPTTLRARPLCLCRVGRIRDLKPELVRKVSRSSTVTAAAPKTPSIEDLASRDKLLDTLLQAKSQEELGKLVADNVLTFDQSFWMRLALRHDQATTEDEKAELSSLASTVARLVEAIVKASESQTAQSAQLLQKILAAAADERGEWHWPLGKAQENVFEKAIRDNFAQLDEAVLSNAFAWMRRCKDDGLSELYLVLQRVLQRYAALSLVNQSTEPAEAVLNSVLAAEPSSWTEMFRQQLAQEEVSESAVTQALQKRMEAVVLGVQSGSHSQRVQAEFLKEVEASMQKALKKNKGFGK